MPTASSATKDAPDVNMSTRQSMPRWIHEGRLFDGIAAYAMSSIHVAISTPSDATSERQEQRLGRDVA